MKSKFLCKKIRDLVRASFTFLLTMFRGFFKRILELSSNLVNTDNFY